MRAKSRPPAGRTVVHAIDDDLWALGDYPRFAKDMIWNFGPTLVAACGIGPGQRVLDVAAGTGNVAIRAAEAGADVVACDLEPAQLEAGRDEAPEIDWVQADAAALPFADGEFDVVTSSAGVDLRARPPGGGRRARPRLPPRRHDRADHLHARGHGRRVLRAVRPLLCRRPSSRRSCGASRSTSATCSATALALRLHARHVRRARARRAARASSTTTRQTFGPVVGDLRRASTTAAARSSTAPSLEFAGAGTPATPGGPRRSRSSTC